MLRLMPAPERPLENELRGMRLKNYKEDQELREITEGLVNAPDHIFTISVGLSLFLRP